MLGMMAILAGVIALVVIGSLFAIIQTQLWIRRLGSPKRHVRDQARSWFSMQGKQTIRLLLRSLQRDNTVIRREVAAVLGVIGDSRIILPLLDTLDDQEKSVRWEVITALGRLGAFPAHECRGCAGKDWRTAGIRAANATVPPYRGQHSQYGGCRIGRFTGYPRTHSAGPYHQRYGIYRS